MISRLRPSIIATALFALFTPLAQAAPNWDEILAPREVKIPAPRLALQSPMSYLTFHKNTADSRVNWEPDLTKGLEQAKKENRPVFVTMRCLPCKSCSDFDKGVLEGGPDLDPLLLQFITVRLTSAKEVDLRMLPMDKFEDLDTSWWGWLLSPEGRVYGVFGGRDATGDAGRTSKAALIATLKRVLQHHYDPRRAAWDIDGPLPKTEGKPNTPVDLAGFPNWVARGRNEDRMKETGCLHCHQVQEVMHQTAIDAHVFDKKRDLDIWPLPENTGITLERDNGLLISQVQNGSAAAKAGLKPGDQLAVASPIATPGSLSLLNVTGSAEVGARRLFSQADFRAALHRLPPTGPATIEFRYLRDGKPGTATLQLEDGWRKGNNNWRISYAEGVIGAAPGFWAMDGAKYRKPLSIPDTTMAVTPLFPGGPKITDKDRGPAFAAGLRNGDVITAVNGNTNPLFARNWIVWFRLNNEPGQEIKLDVINQKGEKRTITYTAK